MQFAVSSRVRLTRSLLKGVLAQLGSWRGATAEELARATGLGPSDLYSVLNLSCSLGYVRVLRGIDATAGQIVQLYYLTPLGNLYLLSPGEYAPPVTNRSDVDKVRVLYQLQQVGPVTLSIAEIAKACSFSWPRTAAAVWLLHRKHQVDRRVKPVSMAPCYSINSIGREELKRAEEQAKLQGWATILQSS